MTKDLNKKILEAIALIVEASENDVTYNVSQIEVRPLFLKGATTKVISIDIRISKEL